MCPAQRYVLVTESPQRRSVKFLSIKNNLPTFLIPARLQVFGHVHPSNRLLCVADDEVNVARLADPILQMPGVFHIKNHFLVALPLTQMGIATFELHINLVTACLNKL